MNEWHICYRLLVKNTLKDENPLVIYHDARIIAGSKDEAVANLQNEFPMFDIKVVGDPTYRILTQEEYLNN